MNLLALDMGTKTGWAVRGPNGVRSGMESCALRVREGPGMRWLKFRQLLSRLHTDHSLGAIYFEDVKAHGPGVHAAHAYGGFLAVLQMWSEVNRIPLHGVGVGAIKKHWTGKGNALKVDMIRVCRERGFNPRDDNEADAIALLDYARCDQGEQMPTAIEVNVPMIRAALIGAGWTDPFKVPA